MSNFLKRRKMHPSVFEIILSFPKTIWFNFKVLPIKQAVKLPIFVSCYMKIKGINKKTFICNFERPTFGVARIGIAGTENGLLIKKKGVLYAHDGGKIILNGPVCLSRGIFIECYDGCLTFGKNVKMNNACFIKCANANINIGDESSFGWKCSIQNSDGHKILEEDIRISNCGDIHIGNHCWICSESSILKNGYLPDNSVLGYKSILTKKVTEKPGVLLAGMPAKIIKKNINWEV